jgi:plastocyanin
MNRATIPALFLAITCTAATLVAGDISGTIKFEGTSPKMPRIRMNADPVCDRLHKAPVVSDEVVVNGNSTLRNVLIYVKDGLKPRKYDDPKKSVEFDQIGCQYTPHVVGLQTGQELVVVNSDPTLHNVHSLSKENPQFNVAQPKKGMRLTKTFDKPEVFKVKCEVHTWMGAYIGVFANPFFAVSGDDGSFSLERLPAGEYTIEAWHEKYGTKTAKVTIGAKEKKTVDFTFAGK